MNFGTIKLMSNIKWRLILDEHLYLLVSFEMLWTHVKSSHTSKTHIQNNFRNTQHHRSTAKHRQLNIMFFKYFNVQFITTES
jgi:hypothetical protein